jgi:hypothetical protein
MTKDENSAGKKFPLSPWLRWTVLLSLLPVLFSTASGCTQLFITLSHGDLYLITIPILGSGLAIFNERSASEPPDRPRWEKLQKQYDVYFFAILFISISAVLLFTKGAMVTSKDTLSKAQDICNLTRFDHNTLKSIGLSAAFLVGSILMGGSMVRGRVRNGL